MLKIGKLISSEKLYRIVYIIRCIILPYPKFNLFYTEILNYLEKVCLKIKISTEREKKYLLFHVMI